jgi:hypothetical protein
VVNAGIGGNMVIGPADYAAKPFPGGPSALDRLERDLISLPHVSTVIWLDGINDFGNAGAEPTKVAEGLREAVKRLRARTPGVKFFAATLTSSVNSTNGGYGAPAIEPRRQEYNKFLRSAGIFDGVIDFDAVTRDEKTGELKQEFQPNSTTGGPGDRTRTGRDMLKWGRPSISAWSSARQPPRSDSLIVGVISLVPLRLRAQNQRNYVRR